MKKYVFYFLISVAWLLSLVGGEENVTPDPGASTEKTTLPGQPADLETSQPDIHQNDITPELQATIDKGLVFLAQHQSKSGAWGSHYNVAVTSLAGLAFLAGGNLPGEGKYGDTVRNALNYIMRCATKAGYICEPGIASSRMHGHGFATWFLAEIYGMSHHSAVVDAEEIKKVLRNAIKVIEESQSSEGGWYYEPNRSGDEGSVTVCIVQALRAARNAGISVDKKVIDRGVDYLKRSANPDGSFKYSVSGGGGGSFALTAGGVSSLCLYGMYDLAETKKGLEFMMKFKPGSSQNWQGGYPFYSNFYATLATFLAGDEYWPQWFPPLRQYLIKNQAPNGSWTSSEPDQPDYGTAFACLILQIPYRYLPLFQK
ncbi:MAG: prenyltransferase/squalene oxidase repeat-containing protein [Planctomycetota bacterium]